MVNEWTRDDLPDFGAMGSVMARWKVSYGAVSGVLDAVVAHLNANGGTPVVMGQAANNMLRETLANVETDRDRWRRAHAIVEQERDQAREQRVAAETARNSALVRVSQAEDERDQALRERDGWMARADKWHGELQKVAPVRTVTREDVEKSIRAAFDGGGAVGEVREMADTVWSLVSGADPAVFVVRESDVAAVEVQRHEGGGMETPMMLGHLDDNPTAIRNSTADCLQGLAETEALARAIESDAEPAVDPLLDKAQEFAALADWELTDREAGLLHTVAAHVLGQEAGDE